MFACVLNMLVTTYGSIWSEWTVCKGSWCPWSIDVNSTPLQNKNNDNATPSGPSSVRSIFNAIIHMRHTTYPLQNTHAIETEPHTHTCHRQINLFSDWSSTQSFTCATRLTYCKIHKQEKQSHTHTHATVRSIFSQIDLQRNHSHAPHDLQAAKYTRKRNRATHTIAVRCLQVPWRYERRLTAVFEVNEQSVNVPDPPLM